MQAAQKNTLRGALLGGGLAVLVFGAWFWAASGFNTPSAHLEPDAGDSLLDALQLGFVGAIFLSPICGPLSC